MTTGLDWAAALDELRERAGRSAALRPYCEALLPALELLRADPRVKTVALQVSHATVVIALEGRERRVGLAWDGRGHYEVSLVEVGFDFVESRAVTDDAVVETVVHYLNRVRA